jgi:murein DD-endopeptidase MepM/ murein hydrolase activator NlpD
MTRSLRLAAILAFLGALLVQPAVTLAIGNPRTAAVQVALRAKHLYGGTVDGETGPATTDGLEVLQHQAGLAPDGVAGPQTLAALGPLAGPELGTRPLAAGAFGGDVVELQFLLAWHGFPSGTIDGAFGWHTEAALRRFQRWAGLPAVGVVGPATIAALRGPIPTCPLGLAWPLRTLVGDRFGPLGAGFHPGIDLPAPAGTPVHAAGVGRVVLARPTIGGYGNLVAVRHADGVETFYAHLSRILVAPGEHVTVGSLLGLVGSTGRASGPHLHFEVRVRGAAVDPLPALGLG